MAYLVIAIGVLTSLIGVFAIVSGFPIIEVERGWAELISGSTMLAGGLVTLALGLVLKTLTAIKKDLGTRLIQANGPPISEALASNAHSPAERAYEPAFETASGLAAPALISAVAAPAFMADQADHAHERIEAPFEAAFQQDQPLHEPLTPHEPVAHGHAAAEPPARNVVVDEMPGVQETAFVEPALHDSETLVPVTGTPEPAPPHFGDSYELQTPSTADHDLAPLGQKAAASGENDWLDRAFSELDEELAAGVHLAGHEAPVAGGHGEPHPTAAEALPAAGDTIEAEPLRSAELAQVPAPAATPSPRPAESAVIGRYESEGTSYVMFADGSIEAQSDAGIYRFSSMAELKAFIEG